MRIAILITCHNRRDKTLGCLQILANQQLAQGLTLAIYLVDDGSSDGTADLVKQCHPAVNVIPGDGRLFWGGGMRLAWEAASKSDPDAYLWLNDDVGLFSDAIRRLVNTLRKSDPSSTIIIGSTCDPETKELTYGGFNRGRLVEPAQSPVECETMCGNIVLIPRAVFQKVGNLSPEFIHNADRDYGLRSRQMGIIILVAPGFFGNCKRNSPSPWTDPRVSLMKRLKNLNSSKEIPFRELILFARRHLGVRGLLLVVKVYFRVFFPSLWIRLKSNSHR